MHLSVIIPAYNEEKRIGPTLQKVRDFLVQQTYESEILVVDDGSVDATVRVVESMNLPVRILRNQKNQGKGFTVRQGMLAAKGDFRLFMDADNATDIRHVAAFLEAGKTADVVVASRVLVESSIIQAQPWGRRFLGRVFVILTRWLAGYRGIQDTQCGFKLFSAKAAEAIFSQARIYGFAFDVEILAIASKLGFAVRELPVSWTNNSESRVSLYKKVVALAELWRIRWGAKNS